MAFWLLDCCSMRILGPTALFILVAAACGGSPPADVPKAPVAATAIPELTEAEFAPAVHQVLTRGADQGLLVAVVRRQLDRAKFWLETGHPQQGVLAVTGALYLVRAGEFQTAMVSGENESLAAAARRVAASGNEGGASALYTLLDQSVPAGIEKENAKEHLEALAQWMSQFSDDSILGLAMRQRFETHRSLLAPSEESLNAASDATVEWIDHAVDTGVDPVPARTHAERERAIQTYRALSSGGAALVALYLRNGDASGALAAIDRGEAARTVPGALRSWLELAASGNDPEGWAALFEWYHGASAEPSETGIDPVLARAASWGAAVAYYRTSPKSMRAAAALGWMLEHFGMTEVTPLVLATAVEANPSVEHVAGALTLVLRGILRQDHLGDRVGARRTFALASPILERAAKEPQLTETAAGAYYAMASIESRAAALDHAREEALHSAELLPTVESFWLLSRVNRQRGDQAAALKSVARMSELAEATQNNQALARAQLMAFEIYRQAADKAAARQSLEAALRAALSARDSAQPGAESAAAERMLARILEQYGERRAAKRAGERAFEASRGDTLQLEATVMDSARRGLITRDLVMARSAVQRAIEMNLPTDDIIYSALWLLILEREQGTGTDGTVEEAFSATAGAAGWTSKLRDWAQGKVGATQLIAGADGTVQQTEAEFYVAMIETGDERSKGLQRVAGSPAIDLVEVGIAQDLVAQERPLKVSMPDTVKLP
jgi:cellulose synthase operon protein C